VEGDIGEGAKVGEVDRGVDIDLIDGGAREGEGKKAT